MEILRHIHLFRNAGLLGSLDEAKDMLANFVIDNREIGDGEVVLGRYGDEGEPHCVLCVVRDDEPGERSCDFIVCSHEVETAISSAISNAIAGLNSSAEIVVSDEDSVTIRTKVTETAGIISADGDSVTIRKIALTGEAEDARYNNEDSGLAATDVQAAIDEIVSGYLKDVEGDTSTHDQSEDIGAGAYYNNDDYVSIKVVDGTANQKLIQSRIHRIDLENAGEQYSEITSYYDNCGWLPAIGDEIASRTNLTDDGTWTPGVHDGFFRIDSDAKISAVVEFHRDNDVNTEMWRLTGLGDGIATAYNARNYIDTHETVVESGEGIVVTGRTNDQGGTTYTVSLDETGAVTPGQGLAYTPNSNTLNVVLGADEEVVAFDSDNRLVTTGTWNCGSF